MAASRRTASVMSHGDTSEQLDSIVNGVTGSASGQVGLMALPSLDTLLEIDELSFQSSDKP